MRYTVVILLLLTLITGCVHGPARNPMAQWVPSPNHEPRKPELIVVHYTDQESVTRSLDTLRTHNSDGRVSAHYLIGKDGALFQLVADEHRAWHAGGGRWGTITDVNSASIGIELDNDGATPFPQPQIETLLRLLDDLSSRHGIPRTQVIGHADMAPTRRRDPGPLFPWKQLADAGYGTWPDTDAGPVPEHFDPMLALRLLGYPVDAPSAAIRAYRMRYRGDEADVLDAQDEHILHALTRRHD